MIEPEALAVSDRSRLRRKRERGSYDRRVVDAILDEGLVCHVGFVDDGTPFVVPTAYARVGDVVYLHGAAGNHMLSTLAAGCPACLTVTLLDGLVLSRAALHHSMNFRSVMLFGTATAVLEPEEKLAAVTAVVEHVVPGRSGEARRPTPQELRRTAVLSFPIVEGSAKVRTGGPVEEPSDLSLPVWAGEVPLRLVAGIPVPDADVPAGLPAPEYRHARLDRFATG
jgi:nitroimidazol reductase NimA-like FMN-containing flavoprotein (pyridoxamine 5'-phosphate oxidase superfamily)